MPSLRQSPLAQDTDGEKPQPSAPAPLLYNLGSGPHALLPKLGPDAPFQNWREIRVDADPLCRPDICARLEDLSQSVPDGSAAIAYCSHVLEHFHDHDLPKVLKECHGILRPDGALIIRAPDLAQLFHSKEEFDPDRLLYTAPAGPIRVLDVIYGHRASIEAGRALMAHRTGFTPNSLARRLLQAGFHEVQTCPGQAIEFCAIASKSAAGFPKQSAAILAHITQS